LSSKVDYFLHLWLGFTALKATVVSSNHGHSSKLIKSECDWIALKMRSAYLLEQKINTIDVIHRFLTENFN